MIIKHISKDEMVVDDFDSIVPEYRQRTEVSSFAQQGPPLDDNLVLGQSHGRQTESHAMLALHMPPALVAEYLPVSALIITNWL